MNPIRRLRDVPIQRKLTIISMLTSTLALLVAGLAFGAYEQVVSRGAMVDRLSITASMVADNSSAALTFNDPASAAGTLKSLGADPHDLEQNIDAGTRLLRELLVKYGGDVVKALAAYNAGEGAVDRYRGMPPYNETRQYVNKVIVAYKQAGGQ